MSDNDARVLRHVQLIIEILAGYTPQEQATEIIEYVHADLWERALDPATVEAVAKELLAKQQEPVDPEYVWSVQFDDGREAARDEARTTITALLTATLGPKPDGDTQ